MTSIRRAFILAAFALVAGGLGTQTAMAQLGSTSTSTSPFGSLLALGSPPIGSSSLTPAASLGGGGGGGGSLGRPPASPTTPSGPMLGN